MSKIVFRDVTKSYGEKQVFRNDSLELRDGLTFLVGRNGAGKSTLIRMATGIEPPTSGNIELLGESAKHVSMGARVRLGVQMQNDAFLRGIKVKEYVQLYKEMYGSITNAAYDVQTMYEVLEIGPLASSYAYALSGGEKKRLSLMLSVIGNRDLIILDEPTAGIDVEVKEKIVGAIEHLKQAGVTLLVSSHDLDEFFAIATNILIVNRGIVCDQTKVEFLGHFGSYSKVITQEHVDDPKVIESMMARDRSLYCRDRQTLVDRFGEHALQPITSKDLYELAMQLGDPGDYEEE